MKKLALIALALVVAIIALGLAVRRNPAAVPFSEDPAAAFRIEPAGAGTTFGYSDPTTPLRAVRWLPPQPGGIQLVQITTQSDRQMVAWFKDGAFQATCLVPKPTGVRDGFFRLAELADGLVIDSDAAILLYRPADAGSAELPLALALDLTRQELRWMHRAAGDRLALAEGAEPAVYLYGPRTITRLPVALVSGEHVDAAGQRSSARTIDLPPEIQEIGSLLPTAPGAFLVAHRGGLSCFRGAKGWLHQPSPQDDLGWFKAIPPVLGGSGNHLWWQPRPGLVLRVQPDGTPKAAWSAEELATAEPFVHDAALLHLLGEDAAGRLWFDLATPVLPTGAAAPAAPDAPPPAEAPAPAEPPAIDWPAYVGQGLDRVYCWDPRKRSLQRIRLSTLAVPSGFTRPGDGRDIRPAAGALSLRNGQTAWVLPLAALPLGDPSQTAQPR
jgi:hypothetical protein